MPSALSTKLSGADLIVSCPFCQAPGKVFSPIADNNFGAITWTDGYLDAPMMPRPPRITRCQSCSKAFWVGEAIPHGYLLPETEPTPENAAWREAPHLAPLDEAELFQALADGLAYSEELELELRVAAWWRGNDRFRVENAPIGYATSAEAMANMERFIAMTVNGDEALQLFRAEALRHLGRFEEMERSLEAVGCSDYWPAKSKQLELARTGDRRLHKLFTSQELNAEIAEAERREAEGNLTQRRRDFWD